MRRRQLLHTAAAAALLVATTGCDRLSSQRARPTFHGIDITGAPYGNALVLQDADGKDRSLTEFRGKVVALFFGFTQCPDICPTTLSDMAKIRKDLGSDGAMLQVLFVSVDPKRDTPELLRQYVPAFDPTFIGLRGDAQATAAAAKEFRIYYREVEGKTAQSYTVDHSSQLYLIDRAGRLRLIHMHGADSAKVLADIRTLILTS
jgi:protein SCO1